MTRADLIRMAREAGIRVAFDHDSQCVEFGNNTIDVLEEFAALVAAAEREACAAECDAVAAEYQRIRFTDGETSADNCAEAIRARGAAG